MALNQKPFGDIITFTRASAATRINSLGVMESVAANVPRIDYDPITLAVKGLLVEEQRTNLLTYSADPTNAAWIKNSASIGAGATGPAGLAAQKLVEASGASLSPSLAQTATVADAATVTGWRFVKAGERSFARMQIASSGGLAYAACRFNLADGAKVAGDTDVALNSATNVKSGSINWGGGWWLLWLSCTLPTGAFTASIQTRIVPDAATLAYTGDGSSGFYVGPAQLEVGGFPTSYIATTTAQVTRAADVPSLNTLSPWFNPAEGVWVAKFRTTKAAVDAATRAVVSGNTAATRFLSVKNLSSSISTRDNNAGPSTADVGDAALAAGVKSASAYSSAGLAVCVNGGAVQKTAVAPVTIPSTTQIAIGHFFGVSNSFLCGHLESLKYLPKRPTSDAALQALTA